MTDTTPLYIAITMGYYGTGHTPEAAKAQAHKAGATKGDIRLYGWLVKKLPDGATKAAFDGMCISWEGGAEDRLPDLVERPSDTVKARKSA